LVLLRVWGPRPGIAGAATAASSGKITLTSPAGANLARFPARRVVFCGAYADDVRFFGLVTSASTNATASDTTDEEDIDEEDDNNNDGRGGCSTSESRGKMLNTRRRNPAVTAGATSGVLFFIRSVKLECARSVPLPLDGCSHPTEKRKSGCDRHVYERCRSFSLSSQLLNCMTRPTVWEENRDSLRCLLYAVSPSS
jgi:hypothetical protein